MSQITLLTGPERRRRWSDDERRRILVAAFTPGAVVADISRQFGKVEIPQSAFLAALKMDA